MYNDDARSRNGVGKLRTTLVICATVLLFACTGYLLLHNLDWGHDDSW